MTSTYFKNEMKSKTQTKKSSSLDLFPMQGSRRSLEYGGNNATSDYGSNRYSDTTSSYRRPYEPSSRSAERPATFRPREVSSQRSRERMAPPKTLPPRRPRGTTTYRGRSSLLRGTRRPPPPTQTVILRKKYLSLKSRTETARRVKIARLRRYDMHKHTRFIYKNLKFLSNQKIFDSNTKSK